MKRVIFYSWQSTLPNNTNRSFIQQVLEEAASAVADDLGVEPVIDRDTQNVPGSPDIAQTILRKIADSHVMIADVSFINGKSAQRRMPNPNVLVEVGYALHALGHDRVVLVFNRHYGKVEQLPFDLRMRRVTVYDLGPDGDRPGEKKRLTSNLRHAISGALASVPPEPAPASVIDAAVEGIEGQAPTRTLGVRKAMTEITERLRSISPPQFRSGGTVEALLTAIEESAPIVRDFTRVSEGIAATNDEQSARVVYRSFDRIFEQYDNPRGSGNFDERDFDFWKFVGHELLVTLIALLLRDERFQVLGDLLNEDVTIRNPPGGGGAQPVSFGYASEYLDALGPISKEKRRMSFHADLLKARHSESGPLGDLLPFEVFIAGDYFLFLRGELSLNEARERSFEWRPWSTLYLESLPEFLRSAKRIRTAEPLATALGCPNLPTLRSRLTERSPRLELLWRSGMWMNPVRQEDIERIGTIG